ncbi:MAG: DUF1080 domain-containing protein [Verrucomicrobia bacterium]|nr:DUF1080 domain-containing protein [Verrucomicrobiota bacterium]
MLGTDDASYDLTGEIRGDVFSGRYESAEGNGIVQLARVRTAPAPLAAPPGATVLFGEKWPEFWREPATWPKEGDGVVVASGPDLVSRTTMRGFRLGLEFLLPLLPEARGDDRARSGVAVGEALEVRIVDSFGAEPTVASCGALVGVAAPRVDAALPPLEWQTLDIILTPLDSPPPGRTAPGRAEVTVLLNGEMLHERRLVENHVPGPLRLRSTGSAVRFRRGWLVAEATDMSR